MTDKNSSFQTDCERFKNLLEFFVAYLNYTVHNTVSERYKKTDTIGYKEHIEPIVDKLLFSGQGYNGDNIQGHIKEFDTYNEKKICINSSSKTRPSASDYLNWKGTSINIVCQWDNKDHVKALQQVKQISRNGSEEFKISSTRYLHQPVSVSDLGLFDHNPPNKVLKQFYIEYYKELDDDLYKKLKNEYYMDSLQQIIQTLETKHNVILHGAPGTGKTYTARNIAAYMMFGKNSYDNLSKDEKSQIGFVQFHPSYDYTDFVEGLRPTTPDANGNIGFVRQDGIFKEFCKRALKTKDRNSDNFDEVWEKIIEKLSEDQGIEVDFITKKSKFTVTLNMTGTGLMIKDISGGYISKDQLYNVYKGLKGVPSGAFDNYRKAIIKKLKSEEFGLKEFKAGFQNQTNEKKYVFIIDEINRGDMSKIFGELFFSMDPGYRGEAGKVKTQYQNLILLGDDFEDGFYVPENVYIIGTMNDIDRSVESMDFAMRRRFVFKEITAKNSAESMGIRYEGSFLQKLNDAIKDTANLTRDFEIGAAYVKGYEDCILEDGSETKRRELWDNNLGCLIKEYLRGTGYEDKIGELANAFGVKHHED